MSTVMAPTRERTETGAPLDEHGERDHQTALRLLLHPPENIERRLMLPTLATPGNVREVVQYLKKKPAGVSIVEALDDVKKRVFEARKIAAYEFWGIVERDLGVDRLRLSPLGWEFARKLEPETEAYRTVLRNSAPYQSALRWMHQQNLELVTHINVAAYWQQHDDTATLEPNNDKTLESSVVCFFHLCQAAELGTVTIGKRGQPARLRLARHELAAYIEATASTPPLSVTGEIPLSEAPRHVLTERLRSSTPTTKMAHAMTRPADVRDVTKPCLFISTTHETRIINQLQSMLDLADIKNRIALRTMTAIDTLVPFSDEIFQAMRECAAALIVVTKDDSSSAESGACLFNQNILTEIGAAYVLYERRVLLLIDEELCPPSSLRGIAHFKFNGGDLTWDAGVKLMKAIKAFINGSMSAASEASPTWVSGPADGAS